MDATEFRRLQPMLSRYLQDFSDCFSNKKTRAHLKTYVFGQLSNFERKSVEPIADAAGAPVRTLQGYLSQLGWDEDLLVQMFGDCGVASSPTLKSVDASYQPFVVGDLLVMADRSKQFVPTDESVRPMHADIDTFGRSLDDDRDALDQ